MRLRDEAAQLVHPRLRMIYNGDDFVNALRAERSAVVRRTAGGPIRDREVARLPDWTRPARGVLVSAFVELRQDKDLDRLLGSDSRLERDRCKQRGKLVTAELTPEQIHTLATNRSDVTYIESGEILELPNPSTDGFHDDPPARRELELPARPGPVLIGIVDVGGVDFSHPDFVRRGRTRFHAIWDQGLPRVAGTESRVPYGREITEEQINAALKWSDGPERLPATELIAQSLQVPGSHATHVAGIVGGKLGVCPYAVLAAVSVSVPPDELHRTQSFFDSTRLAHAVDYLDDLATELKMPLVINISLGTNGHAHDGTSPINRWIERLLDSPGRCVVVAAGNAGQEAPHDVGDVGFLSGRIHSSGRVEATGLEVDLEWEVLGGDRGDLSENEMEIWYEPQDAFDVFVRPPDSATWLGPIEPGSYLQNYLLKSNTLVSIYSERYHPANGANRISLYLSPRLREPLAPVRAGRWTVRLRGREIRDGRFDAWIERDDPRPIRPIGRRRPDGTPVWGFPSLFSAGSNRDESSVSSLGCSERMITVANYDAASEKIHASSSQGPTRDGRFKPEIAAEGTNVVSANGFGRPNHRYVAKTGTSMASPYVAGVAAAMLSLEPRLNASQIVGIMRRTAQPLPGYDYRWRDAAGFGRIQPARCLAEVTRAFRETDHEDVMPSARSPR